ncbi:hypothetical protein G6F56_004075 [Rhizopus delemar]|nr:hypothetical protein G6F56_004075 [Rhizopus delemar]
MYDNKKSKNRHLEDKPKLERTFSTGTLSRVKRFGSKLIRSKTLKESSRRPPPLELRAYDDIGGSRSSLAVSSVASSIDEHVKTPTTADYCKQTFGLDLTEETNQENELPAAVITEIEEDKEMKVEEEEKEEKDESQLSGPSLVRYHLAIAFKQADQEIEQEFQEKHKNMLKMLNSYPKRFF